MRDETLLQFLDIPRTRFYLSQVLQTPRTTIFDRLEILRKQGLVKKFTRSNGKCGRPITLWVKIKVFPMVNHKDFDSLYPYIQSKTLIPTIKETTYGIIIPNIKKVDKIKTKKVHKIKTKKVHKIKTKKVHKKIFEMFINESLE